MESKEILEVQPLRMIPPEEPASNCGDVSDFDSPKVAASPCNSANKLPPGWTVETKIKSSGLKYKVYVDPDTGKKFYSLVKVQEYLQNSTPCRHPNKKNLLSRATTTCGRGSNWLPPNWIVQIKEKMSGTTAGTKYKVYIEKSTGKKLYSQSQVLDYLKSSSSYPEIKHDQSVRSEHLPEWLPQGHSWQAEIESDDSDSTAERKKQVMNTEIEETNVEGLPPGWFKAIKYRESKDGIRRKTALYVDPISGYAFFSTKDALRYIDNGHIKDCRMKPTFWSEISKDGARNKFHSVRSDHSPEWVPQARRQAEIESDDSDCTAKRKNKVIDTETEETYVEGLPPGWFKAIRYRESGAGIRRKTALYVDSISGYVFFSTKDALRYIDNGHIKDCRMKPTFWSVITRESARNKFHLTTNDEERGLKSERTEGKKPVCSEESDERRSEEDIIQIDDSVEESEPKPKERLVRKTLFSEQHFKKMSEDGSEGDDLPIEGAEKPDTAEKGKEKMPETPPAKRSRIKVLASKTRASPLSSKSTSSQLTGDPSSVCPMQTKLKSNADNPESEQKEVPQEGSFQQVDSQAINSDRSKASPSVLLGESSLDPCLQFAFKTLTEDI